MRFKNKSNYQKWLAYGHGTGVFERTPGNQPVCIAGKRHRVKHNR